MNTVLTIFLNAATYFNASAFSTGVRSTGRVTKNAFEMCLKYAIMTSRVYKASLGLLFSVFRNNGRGGSENHQQHFKFGYPSCRPKLIHCQSFSL